jgi:hypothetical protein
MGAPSGSNVGIDDVTSWFLSYVRGRRRMMVGGGLVATALGVILIVTHQSTTLDVWMGGLILFGVLLLIGSLNGRRVLREIIPTLSGPCRTMELRTWGYRSPGSRAINCVLATLDEVGGTNRTPKIEFKAIWFTPGIGESPSCEARVYGGEAVGRAVFAIGSQGAVMGRVKKLRPT